MYACSQEKINFLIGHKVETPNKHGSFLSPCLFPDNKILKRNSTSPQN